MRYKFDFSDIFKEELEDEDCLDNYKLDINRFYKERKLIFASNLICINIYRFDSLFIYQEFPYNRDEIIEKAYDDEDKLYFYVKEKINIYKEAKEELAILKYNLAHFESVFVEFPEIRIYAKKNNTNYQKKRRKSS